MTGGERPPELRVSQRERDEVAAQLANYCSEGRLTLEEFSERVEVVLAARTQGELDRVTSDLPAGEVAPYESRLPTSGWLVSFMSSTTRRGRWRPRGKLRAVSIMGSVDLDLRSAEIDVPELTIHAWSVMGSVRVTVPEGVAVHMSGVNIMGDKSQRVSDAPLLPGAPIIKVRAVPIMGSVLVRSRRTRPRLGEELRSAVEAKVRDHVERASWGRPSVERPGRGEHGSSSQGPIDAREALALAGKILEQLFPRPDGRGTPGPSGVLRPPSGTVTILFCDVSGFAEMTERLGDIACQRLLATYFEIVREQVQVHGGYEVKCNADEAMVAFDGAGRAVRCAIDIQRALVRYSAGHRDQPIRAHIGLHTGEAIQDGGDFLGRTVVLASRITDAAGMGEILVSSVLRELTAGHGDLSFGEARTVVLQGISESQRLFPVLWT